MTQGGIDSLSAGVYRPARCPQANIPQTKADRESLLRAIRDYVGARRPVPPLSLEELHHHAGRLAEIAEANGADRKYIAVLLNNELWREALAAVPYDRRLLLLPQCLRDQTHCPAEVDEYGLICASCGRCAIADLQAEAEKLGYAVLVAEGTAVVTSLVESGKIQAVVGASCLSVLEKMFPYMEDGAIPGIAIPLLNDGCADTSMDLDWLWDAIYLTSADRTRRLDLDALREQVDSWFLPETLDAVLGPARGQTEEIARDWLVRSGKRWRPFLVTCAFAALQDDPAAPGGEELRKIAVAVECFHKASLVHDDIEDGDERRYGRQSLHAAYGVPIALNVGDFLLGEGYRMIAECGASPAGKAEMLSVAVSGHRQLCLGQGAELCWRRRRRALSVAEVVAIFRGKTAPAFEVALHLGAIAAGAEPKVREALSDYSEALGIAYQIRDDLRDFDGGEGGGAEAMSPSILPAIACEQGQREDRARLELLWRSSAGGGGDEVAKVLAELDVPRRARAIMESYKHRAVLSLRPLASASLKGLLRRVIGKIFTSNADAGGSNEHTRGAASGRQLGAGSVAWRSRARG